MAQTAEQKLIESLRKARDDYHAEGRWHRFLLDACHGTGGFASRIAAPDVSVLGWAAEAYARFARSNETLTYQGPTPTGVRAGSDEEGRETLRAALGNSRDAAACIDSYLDQFPREDGPKFRQRVAVSHYRNYVGPICSLFVQFVNKAAFTREMAPALAKWCDDVNGEGTTFDKMMAEAVRPLSAQLGYVWVMPVVDGTPALDAYADQPEISMAQAEEAGITVRLQVLYPCNVLDFRRDEHGELVSAKIRTDHEVGDNLLDDAECEERYALIYRDRIERYTVRRGASGKETVSDKVTEPNPFRRVALVSFRAEPTPGDKVRGQSIVGSLAVEARAHFNLLSEKRDHERSSVFAILGVPVESQATPIQDIVGGNGAAIKVPMASNMPLHFVAPPASVAESLQTSLADSVEEMHRIARLEKEVTTTNMTSGVAMAYKFAQTGARLGSMAGHWARAEESLLDLVGEVLPGAADIEPQVTAPTEFGVDDLQAEIASVGQLIEMPIGPTATAAVMKRTIRKAVPNLSPDDATVIDSEIDDAAAQREVDAAAVRAASLAPTDNSPNADPAAPGGGGSLN